MLEFYHYARKGGTLHEILLGLWMNSYWVNQEKWVYGTTGLYCTQGKLHCITAQHAIQQYWRNQFMMAFIIFFGGGGGCTMNYTLTGSSPPYPLVYGTSWHQLLSESLGLHIYKVKRVILNIEEVSCICLQGNAKLLLGVYVR